MSSMVGTLLSVGLDGSLGILPLGHGGGLCLGWEDAMKRHFSGLSANKINGVVCVDIFTRGARHR